ncbi:MAG: NAD(P)-dependent alcohol dehydrogenase [Steroidobacteraceae bacterium]
MTIRIRAAVAEAKAEPFQMQELELDEPRADEVLVRIVACGVCQTDVHVWHQRLLTPLPIVLGHEGSGIVERVGAAVTSVRPGDHVVLSYQACGQCQPCRQAHGPYCDHQGVMNFSGTRLDGTIGVRRLPGSTAPAVRGHFFGQSSFATYALTTERNTVKVPSELPLDLLAPLGCGLQTGAGAVLNTFKMTAGETLAVFGVGAVGLAAIMAASAISSGAIIAVDVNESRLTLARELGATHAINPKHQDVAAQLRAITGRGVNYVFETSGRPEMLDHALKGLATLGQIGFVAPGPQSVVELLKMAPGAHVRFIIQGDAVPQLFIPELISLHRAGRFPFERLVRFYPFEQINEAFADSAQGEVIKPILRMST